VRETSEIPFYPFKRKPAIGEGVDPLDLQEAHRIRRIAYTGDGADTRLTELEFYPRVIYIWERLGGSFNSDIFVLGPDYYTKVYAATEVLAPLVVDNKIDVGLVTGIGYNHNNWAARLYYMD